MKRLLIVVATVSALAVPGHAAAGTVTCTSSGAYPNASVSIHMAGNPSAAALTVGTSHELLVNGGHCVPQADLRKGPVVGVTVASGSAADTVTLDHTGGAFRDTTHGADILFAFDLGAGTDTVDVVGAAGTDHFVVGQAGINLTADANSQYDVWPLNVEEIQLYGRDGADVLSFNGGHGTGGARAYGFALMYGENGNDTLTGSPGNDYLWGGAGADAMNGKGGTSDTANYVEASAGVTVNLATGMSSGAAGADTLANIESIIGSTHDDVLVGSSGANVISANNGNDFVQGGLGDDSLAGGAGSDWVSYYGATGGVTVTLMGGSATGADGSDGLSGFENLLGSPFADLLVGDSQANSIAGVAGNDNLFGVDGNDALAGGDGNDAENGGNGTDSCQNGPGTDTRTNCEA